MPKQKRPQCLKCKNLALSRGLCRDHYAKAYYLIRSGINTEQELVESGELLPSRGRGRRPANPELLEDNPTKSELRSLVALLKRVLIKIEKKLKEKGGGNIKIT